MQMCDPVTFQQTNFDTTKNNDEMSNPNFLIECGDKKCNVL